MKFNTTEVHFSTDQKNEKKKTNLTEINSIHLQNVSAKVNDEIITNVSLALKPGAVYGLVGNINKRRLLLHLICGAITPSEGNILVNDTNITTINNWCSCVTLLEDNNSLFSKDAIHQLTLQQRKKSGAFIRKTSLFDASISSLLNTTNVLILDEAISSLSMEMEEQILRTLCLHNKTSIVILNTARPSSLKYCDHIYMIKKSNTSEISKHIYFNDFFGTFSEFSENYYKEDIF